jgi:hypothetical protein
MANRYTPDNRRQRILAFVRANPTCSTREVADAFDSNSRHIGSELEQLKRSGAIGSMREPEGRRLFWTATGQESKPLSFETPYQPTVRAWKPHLVRHWLDAALFGPAPAQVAA